MKPALHRDFYQYYAGAVVVRHGLWDSLYPIPKPGVYDGPNHFVPQYRTFLFNPSAASHNPAFYPPLNLEMASDYAPALLTYFPEGKSYYWRYIYPPPTVLLLWPLSFVSCDRAANLVWPTISIWSLFALSYFASRIHRLIRGGDTYTEGAIILACMIFSCRGQTHIPDGNVTPILAALIAFSCYALMQGRLFAFSCACIPLLLFKTIGLTWLPLLFLKRSYWRALVYLAVLALFLNGIVVELAGIGIYEKFFSLASKIAVPAGVGIVPGLLDDFGFYPRTLYLMINLAVLGVLYYGYWKKADKSPAGYVVNKDTPLVLVALIAGTMALYCLTNFSIWLPYSANYLFLPFLGWILQEGYVASGYWRQFILGGTVLAFALLITEWTIKGALFHFFGQDGVDRYHYAIIQPCCVFFIPAFFLIVALRRLHVSRLSPKEIQRG